MAIVTGANVQQGERIAQSRGCGQVRRFQRNGADVSSLGSVNVSGPPCVWVNNRGI